MQQGTPRVQRRRRAHMGGRRVGGASSSALARDAGGAGEEVRRVEEATRCEKGEGRTGGGVGGSEGVGEEDLPFERERRELVDVLVVHYVPLLLPFEASEGEGAVARVRASPR